MEKNVLENVPEKLVNETLYKITPENLSTLDLTTTSYIDISKEQVENDIEILLTTFSNIDISKTIRNLLNEYKIHGNFEKLQWDIASAMVEFGKRNLEKITNKVKSENLAEATAAIPSIALAIFLLSQIEEDPPSDVEFVRMKDDLVGAVFIFTYYSRIEEALDIIQGLEIPSILKEAREKFFNALILGADPKVAARILLYLDPGAQLLEPRGFLISRLSELEEVNLAVSLAKGRKEKGSVPSTYYTLPIHFVHKGKVKKAAQIAEKIFPEPKLYAKFLLFAAVWCKDNEKGEILEKLEKAQTREEGKELTKMHLTIYYQDLGLTAVANSFGEKINFEMIREKIYPEFTINYFKKMLKQIHPKVLEFGEKFYEKLNPSN